MMTRKSGNDTGKNWVDLDRMFAEARQAEILPSDRLMDAILRDAQIRMPAVAMPPRAPVAAPRGWLARAVDGLGGWPSLGALAVCACFGFLIGYSTPDSIGVFDASYSVSDDLVDGADSLYSDIDDLMQEG